MQPWTGLTNLYTWLWIIIWWLIAWLFFFLSTWIIESKTTAKRKLWSTCLVAFLCVLLIPIIQGVTNLADAGTGLLSGLGPYIAYFMVIVLLVALTVEYWKSAVLVGFLAIVFLVVIRYLFSLTSVTVGWELFV